MGEIAVVRLGPRRRGRGDRVARRRKVSLGGGAQLPAPVDWSPAPSWQPAPLPLDESERLRELHEYRVLDTLPERGFDEIAIIAAQICETPVAMVSLVDTSREWFKARVGFESSEIPRTVAFSAHAILNGPEPFVVPDASRDPRFAANPLVTTDPQMCFYAGVPIVTPRGKAIGALCVMDRKPRNLGPDQTTALMVLSRQVEAQLELRRTYAALERDIADRKQAEAERDEALGARVGLSQIVDHSVELLLRAANREDALAPTPTGSAIRGRARREKAVRVLVVGDDRTDARIAVRMLDLLGHEADVAEEGECAAQVAIEGRYDLILMDVPMPERTGIEVARKIRSALGPGAPRILAVLSGAGTREREACFRLGFDGLLGRPVTMGKLARAVGSLVPTSARGVAPELPPTLDFDRLTMLRSMDVEGGPTLLALFSDEAHGRIETTALAVRAGDWEQLRRAAHSLQGLALNVGAIRLAALAGRLEDSATRSPMPIAVSPVELEEALDDFLKAAANIAA